MSLSVPQADIWSLSCISPSLSEQSVSLTALTRRGFLGIASATGLVLTGCSTTPSTQWSAPAERNVSINPNGSIKYSPPNYPAYTGTPSASGKVERIITGAGIGYILCRLAGTWQFATACALVWGAVGGATYSERNRVNVDMRALLGQIQNEIALKLARKPESLRGAAIPSQNSLTQHVAIGPITQRSDNRWYTNFEVTWVDSQGRTHFGGRGTVTELSPGKWDFTTTDPRFINTK
jgi:hypothetical protein